MSKEYLEALERIKTDIIIETEIRVNKEIGVVNPYYNDYSIVQQALHRLESIDNANPSEALECLEKIKGMEISSMPFSDEYGTQEVDLNDIRKVGSQLNTDFREYTATIKQALLKAQEQKQYLKWEDLEFKKEEQIMEVILNGSKYKLSYFTDGILEYVDLLTNNEKFLIGRYVCDYEKQFFNDLHLERVEE